MESIKNVSLQDEIKGRECSEYVKEFCPERIFLSDRFSINENNTSENDDSQVTL